MVKWRAENNGKGKNKKGIVRSLRLIFGSEGMRK